jgi:hypothetical protein
MFVVANIILSIRISNSLIHMHADPMDGATSGGKTPFTTVSTREDLPAGVCQSLTHIVELIDMLFTRFIGTYDYQLARM